MLVKNPILPLFFHNLKDCALFKTIGKMGRKIKNIKPDKDGRPPKAWGKDTDRWASEKKGGRELLNRLVYHFLLFCQ
jgi:hypothetical protein